MTRMMLPSNWQRALDAFEGVEQQELGWTYVGKHNVKLIAEMLRSEEPIPALVREAIADHLTPPKGRWCGRLVYKSPPDRAKRYWINLRKKEKAQVCYSEAKKRLGSSKRALAETARRFRMSEGWVKELIGKEIRKAGFGPLNPHTGCP
jgi:hypothetical protein